MLLPLSLCDWCHRSRSRSHRLHPTPPSPIWQWLLRLYLYSSYGVPCTQQQFQYNCKLTFLPNRFFLVFGLFFYSCPIFQLPPLVACVCACAWCNFICALQSQGQTHWIIFLLSFAFIHFSALYVLFDSFLFVVHTHTHSLELGTSSSFFCSYFPDFLLFANVWLCAMCTFIILSLHIKYV